MSDSVQIRAALTDAEWLAIRRLALEQGAHASQLVAETLRANLLKGDKPS